MKRGPKGDPNPQKGPLGDPGTLKGTHCVTVKYIGNPVEKVLKLQWKSIGNPVEISMKYQ